MAESPLQRSKKMLEADGYLVGKVETFNTFVGEHGIRQDLFGFLDLVALSPRGTIGVQCCTGTAAAHIKKIKASPNFPRVLAAGWTVEVHAWTKRSNGRYKAYIVVVTLDGD